MIKSLTIVAVCILLAGCPLDGDDGKSGAAGPQGIQGPQGLAGPQGDRGIDCWDINNDGIDDANEDTNGDGQFDSADCRVLPFADQHPELKFNHKSICDAFANLTPPAFPNGCPTSTAGSTKPSGSIVRIDGNQFSDIDADPDTLESGQSAFLSIRYDGSVAYWSLKNAYIVNQFTFPANTTEGRVCEKACGLPDGDADCIASYATFLPGATTFSCSVFHYTDSVVEPWEKLCGGGSDRDGAMQICTDNTGDAFRWYALDPGT
ncbi:collagen-like protein [Thalassotalea agarivorans]|uniref:Collagen-like protein n=1 Tax=Thalassotalea agarivorans TaxID=349064 RepID=A0A1H9YAB3_THASX|nr:collagen-like protein [Thalassotalea agarivorans]SES65338.1 hypothetical protein SAMN05660429_00127 [Thalassotalea agarivorans]